MHWRTLPSIRSQVRVVGARTYNKVLVHITVLVCACMLIPPPTPLLPQQSINPSVGPGRTNAEVQRETEAYRAYMRGQHTVGPYPVFQSDYMFMQLPGKPIFLGRIVNDCFMDDAIDAEISFTIGEYTHIQQVCMRAHPRTLTPPCACTA